MSTAPALTRSQLLRLGDKEEAQAQNLANALRSQYFDVKLVGPDGLPSTMAAL